MWHSLKKRCREPLSMKTRPAGLVVPAGAQDSKDISRLSPLVLPAVFKPPQYALDCATRRHTLAAAIGQS